MEKQKQTKTQTEQEQKKSVRLNNYRQCTFVIVVIDIS